MDAVAVHDLNSLPLRERTSGRLLNCALEPIDRPEFSHLTYLRALTCSSLVTSIDSCKTPTLVPHHTDTSSPGRVPHKQQALIFEFPRSRSCNFQHAYQTYRRSMSTHKENTTALLVKVGLLLTLCLADAEKRSRVGPEYRWRSRNYLWLPMFVLGFKSVR